MKLKNIKYFAFALLLSLSFSTTLATSTALAATTGTQIVKEGNGVKATLTFDKDKLMKGSNTFTISFVDKNGNALAVDNLKVTADMDRTQDMGNDGMENKDPMMIDLQKGSQDGVYTGKVDFTNTGKWMVSADFNLQNQPQTMDFNFDVMSEGPNWLIIGGFGGVIVLILVVAVISKKSKKA
jgi:hypothetical protein